MTVNVKTNQGVMNARIVRDNAKTFLVELPDGNWIHRHKTKHSVSPLIPERNDEVRALKET